MEQGDSNYRENVYKQIIIQQQELIKRLVYQVSEEGRQMLPPTLKNELTDLQRKTAEVFFISQQKSKFTVSSNAMDSQVPHEEEYGIGAYEAIDSRPSSLANMDNRASSSAEFQSIGGRFEDSTDAPPPAQPLPTVSQNAHPLSLISERPPPVHIPFVPERISSAITPNIPEHQHAQKQGETSTGEQLSKRITDIKQNESPSGRESPPLPLPVLFGARTDSIGSETKIVTRAENFLKVLTTSNLQIAPFKIQIKRANPGSNQILSFTFKLSTENQVIGFIEKTRTEFVAIEQAIRNYYPIELVQSLGPFPEKADFSGNANGKQTGALLQNWLCNAISSCVDFPSLLEFLSSDSVPPPVVKESFRKQGNLIKKGNYFGGWKTRHFNLEASSGTVFYADAKQSEILGSFSLQYAYAIIISAHNASQKSNDALEKPGFIVSEYKKAQFLPNAMVAEGKNQDGLPLGKIDVRHVFYADTIADRDGWVRCLSGVIARLRPNDVAAQDLFAKTSIPEQKEMYWPSLESLSNSNRPSQTGISPFSSPKNSWQEPAEKGRNLSVENFKLPSEWNAEQRNRPRKATNALRPATTTNANFPSDENLTMPSSFIPPIIAADPAFPPTISTQVEAKEELATQSSPSITSQTVQLTQSARIPSLTEMRAKSRYIDDQTRCIQQALPATLQEVLQISPTKAVAYDSLKKKGGKGKFSEWMKQAAKSSSDILKERRDATGKPTTSGRIPLFGMTIQDATNACRIKPGIDIPAIVYRCIEYLEAKKAADEEGLYRLSGASSVITGLKQKFEEEGDVSLLELDEYYDPHAIAGLLKLFFRELSEPLFTFKLRMNFFQVAEITDRDQKIAGTIELLRQLPSANYACLHSLLSHLLRVVQKCDINKMTVRNVSIVFSPTLGVPAGLFTMMLAEFSTVFPWGPMDPSRLAAGVPAEISLNSPPSGRAENAISLSRDELINDMIPQNLATASKKQSARNAISPSKGFTFIPPVEALLFNDVEESQEENLSRELYEKVDVDPLDPPPLLPTRTVVSPKVSASSVTHTRQISEDTDVLLQQVISPTLLKSQFLGLPGPEPDEDLDMMELFSFVRFVRFDMTSMRHVPLRKTISSLSVWMNKKEEEDELWSSWGGNHQQHSFNGNHHTYPYPYNNPKDLQSDEQIVSELAKLWANDDHPTPPQSEASVGQRSRNSSTNSWLQIAPEYQVYSSPASENPSPSPVPNWAELARQGPGSGTGSANTSGRYATGGGPQMQGSRHMRTFTAPAVAVDAFSPFAVGRSSSEVARRNRTVSSPAVAHSSQLYQADNHHSSGFHSSMPPSSGASTNYYAANQHTPSHAPGFQPHFDSPSSATVRSTGKSASGPSGGGDINSQWNRRKSVEASSSVFHPHHVGPAANSSSAASSTFAYRPSPSPSGTLSTSTKRPSFPSTPNRFVSRQLQQASRNNDQSSDPASFAGPIVRRNSKPDPIGVFVWGFPDAIRVKDIIEAFSCFGDMINVGIDIKNGIKFSFIDYESVYNVQEAYSRIPKERYLGMKTPLQVRLRFDKISKPSFDEQGAFSYSFSADNASALEMNDKRTVHLYNLPHNINKPEIEQVLSQIATITRIKIFQRAAEKKSSVFVSFKSADKARSAAAFMKRNNLVFKEMKEPLIVEYPTQDISRHPPVFAVDPNAVPSLSKKARKLLAASNTIAYARSPDSFDAEALRSALSVHGSCTVYIIRADAPSTAFIKFQTPKACSEALAEKTCGVTLPRHKRVDVQQVLDEDKIRDYLLGVAEIKAITYSDSLTTIEFLTAIGAAQGIVRFESVPFDGTIVRADYSPSLQLLDADGNPLISPIEDGSVHSSKEASDEEVSAFASASTTVPPVPAYEFDKE